MLESQSKALRRRFWPSFQLHSWVQKLPIRTVPRARKRWPK